MSFAVNESAADFPLDFPRSSPSASECWQELPPHVVALLDALPDTFFVKEARGPYLFINRAGAAALGLERGEIIGRSDRQLVPSEQADQFEFNDRVALGGSKPYEYQQSVFNGHETRLLQVRLTPLQDDAGVTWGLMGTARDVTSAVATEALLREDATRLRRLADESMMGVMVAEPGGLLLEANGAALYMLGRSRDEIAAGALYWSDVVSPHGLENLRRAMDQLKETGVALPWETEFLRPDGSRVFLLVGAVIIDASKRYLVYVIDIDHHRQLQATREQMLQDERSERVLAEATVQRLEAILTVTDTALAHLDSAHLLDELLGRICTLLQADSATLWFMEEGGRDLKVGARHGLSAQLTEEDRVAVGEGLVGRVAGLCAPVIEEDALRYQTGNLFSSQQLRACVGVPLVVDDRVTGVLHVGSVTPRVFSQNAVHLLQLVADRAANVIERAQLFKLVRSGRVELDALSRRLLGVQENERRHIARELHDEIGQVLTAVKISLQKVARALPGEGATAEERPPTIGSTAIGSTTITESIEAVEAAITCVRDLSLDLRPPMLDELGLIPTLRWFANRQTRNGAFQCLLDAAATPRLPAEIEIACFRVAQEAITNAARHARASNVSIKLRMRGGLLQLVVTDDGNGFDTIARVRGESLGLLNMEERVRLVGGQFSLKSKAGTGTTVSAVFPLPSEAGSYMDDPANMKTLSTAITPPDTRLQNDAAPERGATPESDTAPESDATPEGSPALTGGDVN